MSEDIEVLVNALRRACDAWDEVQKAEAVAAVLEAAEEWAAVDENDDNAGIRATSNLLVAVHRWQKAKKGVQDA